MLIRTDWLFSNIANTEAWLSLNPEVGHSPVVWMTKRSHVNVLLLFRKRSTFQSLASWTACWSSESEFMLLDQQRVAEVSMHRLYHQLSSIKQTSFCGRLAPYNMFYLVLFFTILNTMAYRSIVSFKTPKWFHNRSSDSIKSNSCTYQQSSQGMPRYYKGDQNSDFSDK